MITSYNTEIDNEAIVNNLHRIGNQIFKLLPMREEGQDWKKPLETLTVELLGMSSLFAEQEDLLALTSKLEGLKCDGAEDFSLYRRTIFETCCIVNKLQEQLV